jgi:hypothetical protein
MPRSNTLRRAGWLLPLALAIPLAHAESPCNGARCELRFKVTATPAFSEAALSAARELTLGDGVQVLEGKEPGVISNLGPVTVVGSRTRLGGAFAGGEIRLGEFASIARDIHARSVLPLTRAAERARRKEPATETESMAWTVNFPTPAQAAVIGAPGAALQVAPGYFRELRLNAQSTATLRTGTYYLDSLTLARGARLRLDNKEGTVVIHVRDFLVHDGTLEFTGTRSDVLITYFGTRRVDVSTKFDGTLFAPYAPLLLRAVPAAGMHEAMFHADILRVDSGTTIRKAKITGRGPAMARLRGQSRQEQLANVVSESDQRNGGMPFPDTATGRILNEAFMLLGDLGPDADAAQAEAARQLRENAEEAVPMLVAQYDALPQTLDTQTRRLTLVEMMRLTSHEVAYEPLLTIAQSPVNPALLAIKADHARPTMYEDIIRARAVNGLGNVARAGSPEAAQSLLDFAVHGSGLQQQYAVRELLSSGDREAHRAALRAQLPPHLQYLATQDLQAPGGND